MKQMFKDQGTIELAKGNTNKNLSQSELDFFKRSTTPERRKTETPFTQSEIEDIER